MLSPHQMSHIVCEMSVNYSFSQRLKKQCHLTVVAVRLWSYGLAGTCHTLILQQICQCVMTGAWLVHPVWRFNWLSGVSLWRHWGSSSCEECLSKFVGRTFIKTAVQAHAEPWDKVGCNTCILVYTHADIHTHKHRLESIWLWIVKLYFLIQQECFPKAVISFTNIWCEFCRTKFPIRCMSLQMLRWIRVCFYILVNHYLEIDIGIGNWIWSTFTWKFWTRD